MWQCGGLAANIRSKALVGCADAGSATSGAAEGTVIRLCCDLRRTALSTVPGRARVSLRACAVCCCASFVSATYCSCEVLLRSGEVPGA